WGSLVRTIRALAPFIVLTLAAWPRHAVADTQRIAVVVGNNVGGPADKPLRFAEEDASKVAEVLTQLGDGPGERPHLIQGGGPNGLRQALRAVGALVARLRMKPDDRTVLVFYYSGHSDEDALELGGQRVRYAELREWLAATRADVRVAVLDGCRSGALVQSK